MYALKTVIGGLATGLIFFYIGVGLAALARYWFGYPDIWDRDLNSAIGYSFGVLGWLMGVGLWGSWGREWFGLKTYDVSRTTGWQRYFTFCTDHKVIGIQYLVTFMVVFLFAGLMAMLIRAELATSGLQLFTNAQYNSVLGLHGILMVAVAVAAVIGGFGNYVLPLMIGADDMAFPRMNALSFWLIPPVALVLLASPFLGGLETGWTAYPPLSVVSDSAQTFVNLAIITFGLSSILGGLNFIITVMFMRAEGMTWGRLPMFVWSMFTTAWLALLYTQGFAVALFMVTLDRIGGMSFFDPAHGGDPLLYQHVFWFYSHPYVYITTCFGPGIALGSHRPLLPQAAACSCRVRRWRVLRSLRASSGDHHIVCSRLASRITCTDPSSSRRSSSQSRRASSSSPPSAQSGWAASGSSRRYAPALAVIFVLASGGVTGIVLVAMCRRISTSVTRPLWSPTSTTPVLAAKSSPCLPASITGSRR